MEVFGIFFVFVFVFLNIICSRGGVRNVVRIIIRIIVIFKVGDKVLLVELIEVKIKLILFCGIILILIVKWLIGFKLNILKL